MLSSMRHNSDINCFIPNTLFSIANRYCAYSMSKQPMLYQKNTPVERYNTIGPFQHLLWNTFLHSCTTVHMLNYLFWVLRQKLHTVNTVLDILYTHTNEFKKKSFMYFRISLKSYLISKHKLSIHLNSNNSFLHSDVLTHCWYFFRLVTGLLVWNHLIHHLLPTYAWQTGLEHQFLSMEQHATSAIEEWSLKRTHLRNMWSTHARWGKRP